MDEIQSKFDLLLCKSETKLQNTSEIVENAQEKEKKTQEMQNNFSKLQLSKEKEMSTEYTFNLGSAQNPETMKPESQFVNNLGTKFLFNAPEENELDFFLYEKNRENPIENNATQDFNNFKNEQISPMLFPFEENFNKKDDKWERLTFLSKKKEIIESMLANVLNKIQECESNKEKKK